MNAYTVSFDAALLNPLREIFDTYLRDRLNREGYSYLFEGMEQINQELTFDEFKFHVTSYGTDKIEYWDSLKQTIGEQSNYMVLPCGHQKGICECLGL